MGRKHELIKAIMIKTVRNKKGIGALYRAMRGAQSELLTPIVVIRTIAPPICYFGMTSPMRTKRQVYTPPTPRIAMNSVA